MTADASSTNALQLIRIKNPTCDSCRWFYDYGTTGVLGSCRLNPPVLFISDAEPGNTVDDFINPEVEGKHWCSYHESAFEDEEIVELSIEQILNKAHEHLKEEINNPNVDIKMDQQRNPEKYSAKTFLNYPKTGHDLDPEMFCCEYSDCKQIYFGVPENWENLIEPGYVRHVCPEHTEFLGKVRKNIDVPKYDK